MADDEPIRGVEFVAEIRQVKTMADHTFNLTLNLPEYNDAQAAWFLQHHGAQVQGMAVLHVMRLKEEVTLTDDQEAAESQYKRAGSLG